MNKLAMASAVIKVVAFFVLSPVGVVYAGPTGFSRSCTQACTASTAPTKFQYDVATIYVYDFNSEVETLVLEETAEKSRLRLSSTVEVHVLSSCDFSIQLKSVQVKDGAGDQKLNSESVNYALEKYSLRFAFQDGQIDHICSHTDEPGWVVNVKRGILSMFQNTMEDWKYEGIVSETDINGKCPTQYSQSGTDWGGAQNIAKVKELSSCTNRRHQLSSIQSIPYASHPVKSLLSGTVECSQTILQNKIERVECHEEQIFKPFEENNSGARNVVRQSVRLVTTRSQSTSQQDNVPRRISTLVFESDTSSSETSNDLNRALNLLKELESKSMLNVQTDAPFVFRELIDALRILDVSGLRSLLNKVAMQSMEKILLNALHLVNTAPSLNIMTDLYLTGGLSSDMAQSWLSSVTFIKYPTSAMISALIPLLNHKPKAEVLLSVSGVMNSYCKNTADCDKDSMILQAIQLIAEPLQQHCAFPEGNSQIRNAIVALKAIGNIGIYVDPKNQLLEKCFLSEMNSIQVRLSALDAHRRISCSMFSTNSFLKVYGDYTENTEIRIQAYLIAMKCANRKVLDTVENVLINEVVNQVGSFVWTHLTNLQETNRRDKEAIRNLVSNEILQNKFQTDARKYSRNYENSMFSNEYELGAGLDANIIFTEESFLPKSVMANLSVQLFGETVNFLEVGGRFTSPESLLEPIFGPEGYFPDETMSNFLKSTRQKRDTSSNKLTRLSSIHDAAASKFDNSPSGSIYTRYFGHEIMYKDFEINTETSIPNVVDEDGKKWFNVKSILENMSTGKKLGFTGSTILMDVDYSVPTISGIPLTLTFLMGSTVGLTAEGKFNVGKFMERKEVEIYGLLRPNLAVNLDASLTVRLGPNNKFIRSGLSVRNVLRSSTAIETQLDIDGLRAVKAIVNLPQTRQQILEASSKVVFLQPSGIEKVLSTNSGGPKIEHKACLGDKPPSFSGLKLCGEISVPKHFTVTPRSPAIVSLYLEKTDEFNGYIVDYSLQHRPSKTQLTVEFDTPGSKIERRTSIKFVKYAGGSFQATVKTPSKLLDASGLFSSNLKALDVTITDGNEAIVQLNMSLISTGNKIAPSFFLEILQKPIADLKGNIELPSPDGNAQNGGLDFTLKHVTENPIRLQGNYAGKNDGSEVTLGVESYYFTGSLRSNIKSRPNHWSSRSVLEYSWKHGDISTIDISAKLQKSQKGALSKLSAAASFIISKYPDHSVDFSWEAQTSKGFCENIAKLVIGKSTWDAHSIYSLQNSRDLTELRLLLSLNNPREELDYYLEFAHRMVDLSINTKLVGRSSTNEVKAKFQYNTLSKPFLHKNLTAGITWPGHEYSLSSALVEKNKGEFDGEILINLNSFKEMKCTISYINNSSNLKLDHSVEFRARGFFSAPVSGNVGFTVTDRQSHIGCQIIIEGKKPYSSRLSTSVDYSLIRNTHKVEAKVTFNEKKYSTEVVFGQTKNGSRHLSVDLFLSQHIFIEAKIAGSYLETVTASIVMVPDKGKFPHQKLELKGLVSQQSLDIRLDYFGDKYSIMGALGNGSVDAEVVWGEAKRMSISCKISTITRAAGNLSLQVATPFEDLRNVTLLWYHEIQSERWSGKLSGGVGEKALLLQFTAGMTPQDTKIRGILDITGYSRRGFHIALQRSAVRDSLTASFSHGAIESKVNVDYKHGRNASALSIQINGFPSIPEISVLWDSQQNGKHFSTIQLDWGLSDFNKKSLHLQFEKKFNPLSYEVSLVTPLSGWKSSSGRFIFDQTSHVYTFEVQNEVSLSVVPKKMYLSTAGSFSSFNQSAVLKFSNNEIQWNIFGHIRALLDTKIVGELKTPSHFYKSHLRSESENGIRVIEMMTDIDEQISELGILLKNEVDESEKNEITAWGTYLSGTEKKANLLLERDSQIRKISLAVSENAKPLIQLEIDSLWTGYKFWSITCDVKSAISFVPSLSFESSHNMLDSAKILNVNSFVTSPSRDSFWDMILSSRNFSSQTVITNLETLYSSINWDSGQLTVAGELVGNDFRFDISSSLFEPISGNVSYEFSDDKMTLKSRITSSGEKIIDVNMNGYKASGKGHLLGTLESKHFPRIESKFLFDQSTGMIEIFITSDKQYIFFIQLQGQAAATEGFLKFQSNSSFFPSINKIDFDTSYKLGDAGDLSVDVNFTNRKVVHHIKGYGSWGENKIVRVTSEGEFNAGVEISLENLNKLLVVATYNGQKLGEVRVRYNTKTTTYAWGHHIIFIEFENGQGISNNVSISVDADPKKCDVTISTPFSGWSGLRVYWEIDIQTLAKMSKFGVHKDGDKLDCLFDLKSFKRNETTMVNSEIRILGFKSLRNILFRSQEDEDGGIIPFSRLNAVEGTFSAFAKWSQYNIELEFKTPFQRWKDLKFTGKYGGKQTVTTMTVTCDINERHHEFNGSLRMGRNKLDADFTVQCIKVYMGKLALDYSGEQKFELGVEGPTSRWAVSGHWTKEDVVLHATTPIKNWEQLLFQAKHHFASSLHHEGIIHWAINNKAERIGYKYLRKENDVSLLITTPVKTWEAVNITLTYDKPMNNINFITKRNDGQQIVVVIDRKTVGTIANISSDGSLTLTVKVESTFEQYKQMRFLTQYDRVGGEHKAVIEYSRNNELVKLNGHFQYNHRQPHSVDIQVDLSSFQNYSSKVQATLSVDPNGNSSFAAVVEFNDAKHEVTAVLDLSEDNKVFGLKTTLPFFKTLQFSCKSKDDLILHGSWEGADQVLDIESVIAGNGWTNQRLNLSVISPFEGLRHIFLYADFKVTPQSLGSSFLFENEDFRWLGKLEGEMDGLNGNWNGHISTPLKGYQNVAVKLIHTWRPQVKGLTFSIEGNSMKLAELDASLKLHEILFAFDSIIIKRISTQSSIKWGNTPATIQLTASSGEDGDKELFEVNVQGFSSGMLHFHSVTLNDISSKLAWKVDGSLENGSAWASITNTLVGSPSIRGEWKVIKWNNIKIESWLRWNETADEIGGMGLLAITSNTDGSYKTHLHGNWVLDNESQSVSVITKFVQDLNSYSGEITAESSTNLFRTFVASASLAATHEELSLNINVTHNDAHILRLDSNVMITLPKSKIIVTFNASKITHPFELVASYDVSSEKKFVTMSYKQQDNLLMLQTILLTPQNKQEVELTFNMSSNVSSIIITADGLLIGTYRFQENGVSEVSLGLTSEKFGNWNFVGAVRPSSDFYVNIELNSTSSEPTAPVLIHASWRGNLLQKITSRISFLVKDIQVNSSLSVTQDSIRLTLTTPVKWVNDIELEGFLNSQSNSKDFEVNLRRNGEKFQFLGNYNISKHWNGVGSISVTKGNQQQPLGSLKFGLDTGRNLAITGYWSGHEVQAKGRFWTSGNKTWAEMGHTSLAFLVDNVEKCNLKSVHKFMDNEYLFNVTSGDDTAFNIHVVKNPVYIVLSFQWNTNDRVQCLIDIKRNEFDVFFSSPWTSELTTHALFENDASHTTIEGLIVYDKQRSWGRLHTTNNNDSVQFNMSIEVPALHQKLLTTLLIQSSNAHQSGGAIQVNVNGHQFVLNGELSNNVINDEFNLLKKYKEKKLSLSFILPMKGMNKVSSQFSMKKPLHSMHSMLINASFKIGDEMSSMSLGYELPSQIENNNERVGVNIILENHIRVPFKYGARFFMNGLSVNNMEAAVVYNDNSVNVDWTFNLPDIQASLRLSTSPEIGVLNNYYFSGMGYIDPSNNIMNISMNAVCKDKTLSLDLMIKLDSKGIICEVGLISSHPVYLDHRYRFHGTNTAEGRYEMGLSGTISQDMQDTINVDFEGDLVIEQNAATANGKMTGSLGSLYGRIDYSKGMQDVHEVYFTVESPSLITGKKMVIRGEITPKRNGFDLDLQCRTRVSTHTFTLNFGADPLDGDIQLALSSPQFQPVNLQVSWKKNGSKLQGFLRANFEDVINVLETFFDVENLEGRVKIMSPLIPSSHFDVHLKSLFSSDKIDILGDVHIREFHWRFEGALKYQNWRDMVVLVHLLTPHQSFDRLTLALKSSDDEIYGEIYTPIIVLPKAMFKITGFRAIQNGDWHDVHPGINIGLPFGKYSLSGIYITPNSTTPGKLQLYFEDGPSSEVYVLNAELSQLSRFNFNMAEIGRVYLSLATPIQGLPDIEFEVQGKVRGRNVVHVATKGKLNNDSVNFVFDYNNDNGSPTISSKLSSPFKMYEKVALSLSFDSFQKIGNGRSLHMVLENPEWIDQITLNADYRYQYTGFLTIVGEVNAELDSFMDIPGLHFALQTNTEEGFSGIFDAKIGCTPGVLKVNMQMGDEKCTLLINGTAGEDNFYTLFIKTDLIREEESMQFASQVSVLDQNVLSAQSSFSTALDAAGAKLDLTTPWGPLYIGLTLIPISPLFKNANFSIEQILKNSNATLNLKFDEQRLLGLQLVCNDGVGVVELFNPIAPVSLMLSLKRVSKSSLAVVGEFCWDLDEPIGNTVGGGIKWDSGLLGHQAGLTLRMEKIGNVDFDFSHSFSSSVLNQTAFLEWNSPIYKAVGRSGYHVLISKGSVLKNKNYETLFQLDLPWRRSLLLETWSNNNPQEFVSSVMIKWDALRDESKSLGLKWQEEMKAAWKATEISDFLEISHPMSPFPVTISTERIYRNGRFQLIEAEINGSEDPENAIKLSIFRNNTNWNTSKVNIRHTPSNTFIVLNVQTTDEHLSSKLSYMDVQGLVRNLTLDVVSKEDSFDLILFSSTLEQKYDIVILKNHRYQDVTTLNCKFLPYEVDGMFLTSLPFLEILVKHNGGDILNMFGGYSNKKKVGAHLARVESDNTLMHYFQATAELTSTNAVAAKVNWLPDLFSNLLELKIPTEISSSIFTDINSLRVIHWMENELTARWETQLSPELRQSVIEFKNFVINETTLIYEECVQLISIVVRLYDKNMFYIKDIFSNLQLLPKFTENVWSVLVDAWTKVGDYMSSLISETIQMYANFDGRLENLVMYYWKRAEQAVESTWQENVTLISSVFNKLWDASKTLLDVLEGKIEEMEEKVMAVGLIRKLIQVYKEYATWLEEIPLQEFTRNVEAMMNIRIWDRLKYYLDPLIDAIRNGVEDEYFKDLLETPPLPFIRYGISTAKNAITKFWDILELEQRVKSWVRTALRSFDGVIHRYLPIANWIYDLEQGFVMYNQSLSAIQWTDFTQFPRWRTVSEEFQDVSQLTNFYYHTLDTLESLKPIFDLNIRSILPPFGSYGLVAGDHHYITFDKRYFRFSGECSYLLVADLSQSTDVFSLIVNYDNRNGVIRKKSYSTTANGSVVDIEVDDFKVSVNGKKVELPLNIGSLFIRRHQSGLELYDKRGFTMTCSLSPSVCTVGVSGWHFGRRLAGILGTYDNEPTNDLQNPNREPISDVSAFAYSWRVGSNSGSCRMKNFAKDESELIDIDNICYNLLRNRSSPLRPCFNTVDTEVFMQMCKYDVSRNVNSANRVQSACSAMNAYVTECQKNNVDVWMPPTCVRCRLEDGSALTTGENATLQINGERLPPKSSDNVIILQEASCISSSVLSEAIKRLDLALQAEGIQDNRYAVVGYGGNGAHEQPHIKTSSAKVWAHNTLFKIPNDTISEFPSRVNLYDAVHYSATLGFRAGVAKNFIAVTCGEETCGDSSRYADGLTLLVENDIKLHMLVSKKFTLKGNRKDELNDIFGMDMNGVYTVKHAKSGILDPPNLVLKRQINVPKDFCTPLAMESNGTRFNVEQATKKVLDVWSRRVAQASHPSSCQRCECVPDRFGSASMMCHQCVSPSLWRFMEEWKSYQSMDGEEFPAELLDHSLIIAS